MSIAKAIFKRAAKDVNNILGSPFTYTRHSDGDETTDCMITIDRNKKVHDEFNNLIGYRVEASILKSDIPNRPASYDTFTDGETTWRVGEVTIENDAKWYVDVVEV